MRPWCLAIALLSTSAQAHAATAYVPDVADTANHGDGRSASAASIFERDAAHAPIKQMPPAFPFGQQPSQRAPSRWFFALLGLGVVGAGLWVYCRQPRTKVQGEARIDVLATRSLGPRHQLALIEAGGERLLLCTSSKGVTLLSHLGAQEMVAAGDGDDDGATFDETLVAADARGIKAMARGREGQGRLV